MFSHLSTVSLFKIIHPNNCFNTLVYDIGKIKIMLKNGIVISHNHNKFKPHHRILTGIQPIKKSYNTEFSF